MADATTWAHRDAVRLAVAGGEPSPGPRSRAFTPDDAPATVGERNA